MLKNLPNARNTTHKYARRIKNLRTKLVEENIQISINKLRDRKQIVPEVVHKSNMIQGEVAIYIDDASTKNLTLLVIPKRHILLG
jgi:hypothetical protein